MILTHDFNFIFSGCERYLIHKFIMSEADAKFWYKSHMVLQCDFCELIYNQHDLLDKHIFEVHQDELVQDEPPEPQRNEESDTEEEDSEEEEDLIPDFEEP
jgi:hypothetical protein